MTSVESNAVNTDIKPEDSKAVENVAPKVPAVTHPLQYSWTLWYDSPHKEKPKGGWRPNHQKVFTFDTVEDFWSLFNNLNLPSSLGMKCNYMMFKEGATPEWESKDCVGGGQWEVEFASRDKDTLNKAWTFAVLGLIGESFEDSDNILGVTVNIRKAKNRIELWTKQARNEAVQKRIGAKLKQLLELEGSYKFQYSAFDDVLKAASSHSHQPPTLHTL